jgi:Uma2 family endonuclease
MIEILSPASAARDRGIKYDLYEDYGIREYWLVDPVSQFVEVYQLTDGEFDRLGLFATDQVFTSPLLGQTVMVSQLLGSA